MTKKDFEFIARVINQSKLGAEERLTIASEFSVALRATNERFNMERFVDACMKGKGE